MAKSIRKNYIYNTAYQILVIVTPLITTPYVSRILDADGIGKISYVGSVESYFGLFATLGITTYGQREISYFQNDRDKRSHVFWNTKFLEVITTAISLIAYMIFSRFQSDPKMYYIYAVNLLSILVDVSWLFQGMEDFGSIVFKNFIFKMISIAFIFAFIHEKEDIYLYAFWITFSTFAGNISLWLNLKKYIVRIPFHQIHPFKNFKTVLSLFVPTVAVQVYTYLDKTMIGVITKSAYENGYYEQAIKISKMVLTVVTSLSTVMIPRIGFEFAQGHKENVQHLMYRGYRFVWFLGLPLCFGLIMIAPNFVPWFFGPGYEKVIGLLGILSFLILAIGMSNITGLEYLVPTKRQNLLTLSVCVGAAVNLLMNSLLIPKYQSIGASIGSVIAETAVTMVQFFCVRKELSIPTILKQSIPYLPATGTMVLLLYFEARAFSSSMLNTFIMILTGVIVYFGVLFLEKDEFFINNIKYAINKLKAELFKRN